MQTTDLGGLYRKKLAYELRRKDKAHRKRVEKAIGGEPAKIYMRSEHEYYMKKGEARTPFKTVMTGREAKLRNAQNVIKFGSGEHSELIRWCYIKGDKDGNV